MSPLYQWSAILPTRSGSRRSAVPHRLRPRLPSEQAFVEDVGLKLVVFPRPQVVHVHPERIDKLRGRLHPWDSPHLRSGGLSLGAGKGFDAPDKGGIPFPERSPPSTRRVIQSRITSSTSRNTSGPPSAGGGIRVSIRSPFGPSTSPIAFQART